MKALTTAPWSYLAREAALILLWSYVLLVGGTIDSLFNFRVALASAVVGGAGLGGWLLWRWRQKRQVLRAGLEAAALLFLAAQALAVAFSQDPRRGLPLLAQTVVYLLIFYCALDLLRSGWPAELAEKTLLIAGGIVLGLALLDIARAWLGWLDLTLGQALVPAFEYRVYAPLGDANLVAAGVVVLAPAAAARALSTPRRLNRWLLIAWLGAALVVLVFTASRGGLAGTAVGLAVLAALWAGAVSARARARLGRLWGGLRARPWLLAVLGLGLLAALAGLAWRVLQFQGSATQAPALLARQEFWPAAVNALRESPLWGRGPGTYPSEVRRFKSVPPQRVFLHAHSVPLNLAAEAGLLGLGAALFALGSLSRAWWRARPPVGAAAGPRWAAAAAGWTGFLVHSQVDDHTRYLAVAVPLAILLAGALAEGEAPPARRGLAPLWLALPALAAALFTAYALRAWAIFESAVEAGLRADWAGAARQFDAAAAADPALAFYWEQAGYAYGRLAADGDPEALAAGIQRLETGARLEPLYAVPRANLAALYWQAGRREEAVAALRQAAALAPAAADYPLNLGLYLEALDPASAEARASLRRALELNPFAAEAGWWEATPLRRAVRAEWLAAAASEVGLAAQARLQIAAGDLDQAERDLLSALAANDQSVPAYTGLAEVARARGDLAGAEALVRTALALPTTRLNEQVDAVLTAAAIAQAAGQTDLAVARYETAYAAVADFGSLGWGTYGWTPHAFFAFQRRGLPLDVVPQVTRGAFSLPLGRQLLPLGALYEAAGQPDRAAAVYRQLLVREPALMEARQALARLGLDAP
ncbi:MAG: O-antigen ligase family protein [Anaerolineales bacterium]|nr:O-antigen ligase family protein [Anaerolineales bacterium]